MRHTILWMVVGVLFWGGPLPAQTEEESSSPDQGVQEEPAPSPAEEDEKEPLPEPEVKESTLALDFIASAGYTFFDSLDHYRIKYHLTLKCPKVDLTRRMNQCSGNADITTEVDGFLAKGGNIECRLQTIPGEAPYEVKMIRDIDDRCAVKIKISKTIVEDWSSICLFLDDPSNKFVTHGEPEKLLQAALDRTDPKLDELAAEDCGEGNAAVKLTVATHRIEEPDLGYWELEGFGSLALEPIPEEESGEEEVK